MRKILLLLAASLMLAGCLKDEPLIPLPEPEEEQDKVVPDDGADGEDTKPEEEDTISVSGYYEVPAMSGENPDYRLITHYGETYKTGKHVRNYTSCYDVRRHNPVWVAYPHHPIYKEGGSTRTRPDPWRPDPEMTSGEQSVIYASDWADWPWGNNGNRPADNKNYWSPTTDRFSGSYIKGHLLASADRGAGRSGSFLTLNVQTFYPSNIAPERYPSVKVKNPKGGDDLTANHWTMVEGIAPDKWLCNDTLYVVVGCHYEDDSHKVIDASSYGKRSALSKDCIVPTARYKAYLRTKTGNSGKALKDCTASELTAIAFWFPQCFDNSIFSPEIQPLESAILSVAELERRLGGKFTFFPDVPAAVKETAVIDDWRGLRTLAEKKIDRNYDGGYIYY